MTTVTRTALSLLACAIAVGDINAQNAEEMPGLPSNNKEGEMGVYSGSLSTAHAEIVVGRAAGETPATFNIDGQLQLVYSADVAPGYGFFCCYVKDNGQMRLSFFLFVSHGQSKNVSDLKTGEAQTVGHMKIVRSGDLGALVEFEFDKGEATQGFVMYKKAAANSPAVIVVDGKQWEAAEHPFYYVDINATPPTIQAIPMKAPEQVLRPSELAELTKSIDRKLKTGKLKLKGLPVGTEDDGALPKAIKEQASQFEFLKKGIFGAPNK